MTQVPDFEEFKALLLRVEALEADNKFLKSVLLSNKPLTRKQAAAALGLSYSTLCEYARTGRLTPANNGGRPIYPASLVYDYLSKLNVSQADIEKAIIVAIEGSSR